MNNLILVETILSGILGLMCLSSIIIIIYIMRNYRMMEDIKDATDEFNKQMEFVIKQIMKEEKNKGDD